MSTALQGVGISATTATVAARTLSAALIGTGILAFVALLGMAVSALMNLFDSETRVKDAVDKTKESIDKQNKAIEENTKVANVNNNLKLAQLKKAGADEDAIRAQQIKNAKAALDKSRIDEQKARKDFLDANAKIEAERKQTEFEKLLDKKDADRVGNAMTLQENAIASLNSLNRLNQLDQSALISGSFASGRVGATNLLNTLGLTSAKDQDVLAKSENYQKTAGDVILATLGGRLGSGFSNADREFIQSLVPQLENSPQARKQLIEFMVKKNQEIVEETTRLENYARDKKG